MEKLEYTCEKEDTLFDFLIRKKPNLNYQILKIALRKKDIKINGKKVFENKLISNGDVITVYLPEKKKRLVDVVFEDENILIVSKPAGMETTKKDKTYLESDCLEDIFEGTFACHRLDKNTEGLVILAKSKKAYNQMQEVIKLRKVHKTYFAICSGKVFNEANLTDYLVKNDNMVKIYSKEMPNSKVVKTNYKMVEKQDDLYLLEIDLLTGRTHQIRAHLAFHKIFVLGDQKYGNKDTNKKYHAKRQLLCASKLYFDNLPDVFKKLSNKSFEAKPTFSLDDFKKN